MGESDVTFFIFGAGFSGRAFGRIAPSPVLGTTRKRENFSLLESSGISPLLFDGNSFDDDLKNKLNETTHLIISIAPDENGDRLLPLIHQFGRLPKLQWICYLSTVGVYGDHQGAWIDETALCEPSLIRNRKRMEAEAGWKAYADACNVPIAVMRLAGIYGPGRNAFIKLADKNAHRIIKRAQVFNRIHNADIAGAIAHFARQKQDGIYNITDNEPAPPQDVITYAAQLMGVEPPPEIPFEKAELSPMARSFYNDNKRISNEKLRQAGYRLKYPNYRLALEDMWLKNCWRQEAVK